MAAPAPTLWYPDCTTTVTLEEPVREGYRLVGWALSPTALVPDYKPGDNYDMQPVSYAPDGSIINPNVLYAMWELAGVTLEYWGFTDEHPEDDGEEQLLKSVYVQMSDLFDPTFDQNKDDDPDNDHLPYYVLCWLDPSWNFELDDTMTIQYIADMSGWDGMSPIQVHAMYDLRIIHVIYDTGGLYEDPEVYDLTWFDMAIATGYVFQGNGFMGFYDENANLVEDTITVGEVLKDSIGRPTDDELYIFAMWDTYFYEVEFIFPNNMNGNLSLNYEDIIEFPGDDAPGFDYDGYEFVGWFDEYGNEVLPGTAYSILVNGDDTITYMAIYAVFNYIGGASVASDPILDEIPAVAPVMAAAALRPEANTEPAAAPQAADSLIDAAAVAAVAAPAMLFTAPVTGASGAEMTAQTFTAFGDGITDSLTQNSSAELAQYGILHIYGRKNEE